MTNNRKNVLIALLSVGIVVATIFAFTGRGNDQAGSVQGAATAQSQSDAASSMASHHGGSASPDTARFEQLFGQTAPDFELESYDGPRISLNEYRGKTVILFFNEGLMCYPACWNQIAAFGRRDDLPDDVVILNIVVGDRNEWKPAMEKMPELAKATVLLDTDKSVSSAYGVLTLPSSMHRGQYPGHSYVIVDTSGIVRFAKDDPQMAVRNKALAEALTELAPADQAQP